MATDPTPRMKNNPRAFDVEALWALDRIADPSLSPDGAQAVASVTRYSMDSNKAQSSLWLFSTLGVVLAFTVILAAGLLHVRRAPNLFHFLLVVGCVLLVSLQAIINIGVVTGLLPTKGMSLPFISAGLSNLLLMGILLGVLINTERTWGHVSLPGRGLKLGTMAI